MSAKTQALDRLLEAISPGLAMHLEAVVQETREELEREFQTRLESAVREAEFAARSQFDKSREETRNEVSAELEQQFKEKLDEAVAQVKTEAAEERTRLETALVLQKEEWSSELTKVEDELHQWRTFAEMQQQLAEASSQSEILARFLSLAQPFAEGMALYVSRADGLALWKSKGNGAFPEIISRESTDPESYFRSISVRGKTVGAICAAPAFKTPALDFLAGSLERAIEVFGLKLKGPIPKAAEKA